MTINQVVEIINSKRSKSPTIMTLIHTLTLIILKHNFHFKALHVAGKLNPIADCISRFQMDVFRTLAPYADTLPQPIPEDLFPNQRWSYKDTWPSLAVSSQKTYSSGEKRFIDFCYKLHLDPNHFATYMAWHLL